MLANAKRTIARPRLVSLTYRRVLLRRFLLTLTQNVLNHLDRPSARATLVIRTLLLVDCACLYTLKQLTEPSERWSGDPFTLEHTDRVIDH